MDDVFIAPANIQFVGSNLYISQQTGSLLVRTTATPGAIEVTDGGQKVTVGNVNGTIFITGTNVNDSVSFKANDSAFAGNLFFNMGNSQDTIALQALAIGGISGSVTVLPGLGNDTTAVSASTRIGGSFSITDPGGINAFIAVGALTVDGHLSISGVTAFVSSSKLSVGAMSP